MRIRESVRIAAMSFLDGVSQDFRALRNLPAEKGRMIYGLGEPPLGSIPSDEPSRPPEVVQVSAPVKDIPFPMEGMTIGDFGLMRDRLPRRPDHP